MATYHEILPERKASKHSGIRWTPAGAEFSPIAGTLVIDTDWSRTEYVVSEFPVGWNGRGFHLQKLTGGTDKAEEAYSCFVSKDGRERTCECKGFYYAGHCKHLDAVQALLENGWL